QQERQWTAAAALAHVFEPRPGVEGSKRAARQVPHGTFEEHHEHVEEKPAPRTVPIAIDDEETSARAQDAVHFRQRPLLSGGVMKAVAACDDVEDVVGEG